jgi:hypothetical protein
MTTKRDRFARRQFLRGAGGAAIGLPFLLSKEGSTRAQAAAPPERLVTVYFAQGIPAVVRSKGLTGALAPLAPFQSKLTMVRGLNCNATSPNNGHSHGSAAFACGFGTPVLSSKQGPSLDWVVHQSSKANTPLPTLSTGISAGDNADESVRYNHSWRGVGQPNLVILDTLKLFQEIFPGGQTTAPSSGVADPVAVLKARQRVSVLDAVIADYQHVMSDAAGYSPSIRSLISNHLDTVRELEKRAVAVQISLAGQGPAMPAACNVPRPPTQMHSYLGPTVGGVSPKSTPYFDVMWPLMMDLYVLAMRCDLVRFGNVMVISGGDSYPYSSAVGSADNIHGSGFHLWATPSIQPLVIDHIHWTMTKIAAFLSRLDDPSFKDVDGASLLDNTTVVIGTELGDDVANHGMTDMPFWIVGARKRFKAGDFLIPGGRSDVDFYNTVLRGTGLNTMFGDPTYYTGILPLLA